MLCIRLSVSRSYTSNLLSVVIIEYQSFEIVKVSATAPSGSVIWLGNSCLAGTVSELNFAINKPTIMMNPTISVTVIVITRIFNHFIDLASGLNCGECCMQESPEVIEVKISVDTPQRLDKALATELPEALGVSRTKIAELIKSGCVTREDVKVIEPKTKTFLGEIWTIHLKLAEIDILQAENIPLNILYEDSEIIVIDKPAGLVVHPARGNWSGTLVNALLHHCGDEIRTLGPTGRPGIVHRLDKDTSGVMVAAKTDRAEINLIEQFKSRTVTRRYHAIVRGIPGRCITSGGKVNVAFERDSWIRLEGAIGRNPSRHLQMKVLQNGGRQAVTRIRVMSSLANGAASLIECKLETGRTHQIRVHLQTLGHALIGDQIYGLSTRFLPDIVSKVIRGKVAQFPRQALHAVSLEFNHPISNKRAQFKSDYPEDMQSLLSVLKS